MGWKLLSISRLARGIVRADGGLSAIVEGVADVVDFEAAMSRMSRRIVLVGRILGCQRSTRCGHCEHDGRLASASTLCCPSLFKFANTFALMLRADFRSLEEVPIAPDQTRSHRLHL